MNRVSTVLFVIDSLSYSGRARQLTHLAAALPRETFDARIVVLGPEAPWCDELRASGVRVETLGWRRWFDVKPLSLLHRAVRAASPDVIHAWGPSALSVLVVSGASRPSRLVVSAALPGRDGHEWLARILLPRVRRIIALGETETSAYRRLGVPSDRLSVVPPGMPISEPVPAATLPGLPPDARVILCLGPVTRHKGHRDAAWAANILRLLHETLHLVLVGEGPALDTIRRLRAANDLDYVHFAGTVGDVSSWLARAEVVWVPSLRAGGRYAVLAAMAAGKPVVASRLPELAELITEGQTGYLVPPGDKAALCRQTRLLLDYPDLAASMGAAGRERVRSCFALTAHVAAMAEALRPG